MNRIDFAAVLSWAFELSRGRYAACLPCVIDVVAGTVPLR